MALIGEMNYLTIGGNTYEIADAQARSQAGSGTVQSVAVSNASNGGLSVSGSPITSSGTISIGHSNVLTSAQTTQAVYPIKIDKNGHISAYGSAVTIPTVPTNVSAFTNDSGYLTSYTETDPTVPSWAKAESKPTYTATEVGASPTGHTHATSIASGGSSPTALSANTTYSLTAGGTTAVFKTPANPDYSNTYAAKSHNHAWSDITSGNDDLNAIEGLTGTSGLLRKTAANTWSLDTKSYITGGSNSSSAVTITPTTTSVYSITNVGTANTPTAIDVTKFNGGSYSHTGFSGGSGSFTQGAFSGGSLTMAINSSDTSQLDIVFTAATHGNDSQSHTAATYGTDSFTAASLGTGFYTAGTAATMPTRSQVTNLWNGYSTASAASQTFTGSTS